MRSNGGYTLLEVAVATSVMAGMFLASGTVLASSVKSWRAAESYAAATASVRNATLSIAHELESASLLGIKTLDPPVIPVSLGRGAASVSFQQPLALDGETWTGAITIRFRTEDRNANMRLDPGEDLDGNGVLDRAIEIQEDLDGNGDFDGAGETRRLANGVDALRFELDTDTATLVVDVTARYPRFPGSDDAIEHRHRLPIYIRN